jgi:hypothetical protein
METIFGRCHILQVASGGSHLIYSRNVLKLSGLREVLTHPVDVSCLGYNLQPKQETSYNLLDRVLQILLQLFYRLCVTFIISTKIFFCKICNAE